MKEMDIEKLVGRIISEPDENEKSRVMAELIGRVCGVDEPSAQSDYDSSTGGASPPGPELDFVDEADSESSSYLDALVDRMERGKKTRGVRSVDAPPPPSTPSPPTIHDLAGGAGTAQRSGVPSRASKGRKGF